MPCMINATASPWAGGAAVEELAIRQYTFVTQRETSPGTAASHNHSVKKAQQHATKLFLTSYTILGISLDARLHFALPLHVSSHF
jgi:hypothetical protein